MVLKDNFSSISFLAVATISTCLMMIWEPSSVGTVTLTDHSVVDFFKALHIIDIMTGNLTDFAHFAGSMLICFFIEIIHHWLD